MRERKAAVEPGAFDELRELRSRLKEQAATIAQLSLAQKELEGKLRASKKDRDEEQARRVQEEAAQLRRSLKEVSDQHALDSSRSSFLRLKLPNRKHASAPVGAESQAKIVRIVDHGKLLPPRFTELAGRSIAEAEQEGGDPPREAGKDHLAIAESIQGCYGGIDMRSGVLSTGPSWPYLLGRMAMLEHALAQFALSQAAANGFVLVSPPEVVKADIAARCGFNPRDEQASQTYYVATRKQQVQVQEDAQADADEHCLVGTAEISVAALLAGRTFSSSQSSSTSASALDKAALPLRLVALSHAFRAEAGARGADTRGLYRVHQFSKAELFTVCTADQSEVELEHLAELQRQLLVQLGLPFRQLDMPSEELGASAARKYDMEVWMPGRGSWGEVSSASNCTDFQARRLHIKYKGAGTKGGKAEFAHTLNATAAAVPRLIVALLESHGATPDGKMRLPACLRPHWLAGEDAEHVEWLQIGGASGAARPAQPTRPAPLQQARSYSTSSTRPKKPSATRAAIERVRAMAARTGTDPASLVVSFLVLHELTAALPLVLLFWLFTSFGLGAKVLEQILPADFLVAGAATTQESADSVTLRRGEGEHDYGKEQARQSWLAAKAHAWFEEAMTRAEKYGRRKEQKMRESRGDAGELGIDAEEEAATTSSKAVLAGVAADAVAAYLLVKVSRPTVR